MKSKQKLLLLKDITDLGRSGELVLVKPGYARNFLLPKKMAVVADLNTIRMQEKLQKERSIIAAKDKKEALEMAKIIEKVQLSTKVKVDAEGKMYGSVKAQDIVDLFQKQNIELTKKNIGIKKPIKTLGEVEVPIHLKEGVQTKVLLIIEPDKKPKTKEAKEKVKKKKEKKEKLPEEKK